MIRAGSLRIPKRPGGPRRHEGWEQRADRVDVTQWLGLVKKIARGFSDRPGIDFDERVSLGTLGLIKAARIYDPARGTKFSTCAVQWIWATIHGRYRAMGYTARRAQNRDGCEVPLDLSLGCEPATPDRRGALEARMDVDELLLKAHLDPRDSRLLFRHLDGVTLPQLAREEGISGERVRQLIERALDQLRATARCAAALSV